MLLDAMLNQDGAMGSLSSRPVAQAEALRWTTQVTEIRPVGGKNWPEGRLVPGSEESVLCSWPRGSF